jgi:uncharacterized membrane protein YhaH (DUF805 family)
METFLFSFKGRISRLPFLLWLTFTGIVTFLPAKIFNPKLQSDWELFTAILLAWPNWAVAVKRWHDRDKSGWWMLINLIPILGSIWTVVELGFFPGTPGDNHYGPDPLRRRVTLR